MNLAMYLAEEATSQGRVMAGLLGLGALVLIFILMTGGFNDKK